MYERKIEEYPREIGGKCWTKVADLAIREPCPWPIWDFDMRLIFLIKKKFNPDFSSLPSF